MESTNIKTQFTAILREVATDIEADWFESKNIDDFFQEIELSIRYQLGRAHGDELKYLTLSTPVSSLQALHQVWEEKKKQISKTRKELDISDGISELSCS